HCLPLFLLSLHDPPTSHTYTLSLHDALPIFHPTQVDSAFDLDRKLHHQILLQFVYVLVYLVSQHLSQFDRRQLPEYLVVKTSLRSEEHTSELQSRFDLVCRLLLEKKNNNNEI